MVFIKRFIKFCQVIYSGENRSDLAIWLSHKIEAFLSVHTVIRLISPRTKSETKVLSFGQTDFRSFTSESRSTRANCWTKPERKSIDRESQIAGVYKFWKAVSEDNKSLFKHLATPGSLFLYILEIVKVEHL